MTLRLARRASESLRLGAKELEKPERVYGTFMALTGGPLRARRHGTEPASHGEGGPSPGGGKPAGDSPGLGVLVCQ
eukprot:847301-Rhodomonas_salina.2